MPLPSRFLSGTAACVLVLKLAAAPGVRAQVPPKAAPDAVARQAPPRDLATTYDDLLREYRRYRRIDAPTDDHAADTAASPDPDVRWLEVDGLVVDETLTKLGRDFYEGFYRLWRVPEGAVNYTVTVEERPLPTSGTLVAVRVDGEVTFQVRLLPRADVVEAAAGQAVAVATRRLLNRAAAPPRY